MKRIYTNLFYILMVLLAFNACSPDEYTHPSEEGLPLVSAISDSDVSIIVNDETNEVSFSVATPEGCMPFWTVEKNNHKGDSYSTRNSFSDIYANAGTYTIELKLVNANGISDGAITKSFTVTNSLVDFTAYINMLKNKSWRIYSEIDAHLACGESGTDGTGWWSASPGEKEGTGLYDSRISFDEDMNYTFDPGESGNVFVNAGSTLLGTSPDEQDFDVAVEAKTSNYKFEVDGDDVYLVLDKEALFPYIASDGLYEAPRYKITSISGTQMNLLSDDGNIAWQYILTSSDATGPGGYDPDSEYNMWTKADVTTTFWFADANWTQIDDPGFTSDGNKYVITMPNATVSQWQAQCIFSTDITTNSATNYDFSLLLNSSKDCSGVTVKLVDSENDGIFYFVDQVDLKAYEDYVFIKTDMLGLDMDNVKLVLDFGGNEANTEVTISRCVLKDHSFDDGTVIEDPDDDDDTDWDVNSKNNLWNSMTYTNFFFYADENWAAYDQEPGFEDDNKTYTITLPYATVSQWQAQVHFKTDMSADANTNYDFSCTLNSNQDLTGVTIKVVQTDGDDGTDNSGNAFFIERVNLSAYTDYVFKMPAKSTEQAMDRVSLVFDFGGNPENTVVTVSNVIFQKTLSE